MSVVYSLVPEARFGGSQLVASLLVIVGFLLGLRLCHGVRHRRRVGERVLILGEGVLTRQVIEEIERRPDLRYAVVDAVVDDAANLGRVIEAARPDRIVVALGESRARLPLYPLLESRARGILVEDAAETYERLTGKLALEALKPSVIFSPDFQMSRVHLALARALSLLAAVIGSLVLVPVLGLIVLLIKLDSRGPVFFIQERVGRAGRSFKLIKFRTMRPVSRPESEWERDNCDRITRVGKWLRRFRLDELPQLVNVVRGEMNLVGPRPHPVTNLALMILAARNLCEVSGDAIPYYSLRCSIRPGITGWAQVRYGYANTLEEEMEKVRYDFYYLKHMSFWLDLQILAETVKIVFCRRAAGGAGSRRVGAPEERFRGRFRAA